MPSAPNLRPRRRVFLTRFRSLRFGIVTSTLALVVTLALGGFWAQPLGAIAIQDISNLRDSNVWVSDTVDFLDWI
ncbi:MAG: hypothetical protein AAF889_03255 [Cyanobacteria bacterium P01_D01_bin.73]